MVESTVESSSKLVVGLTENVPIRVLHVDDDAGFLKVARQLLEMQEAFEVDTALSVKEAVEKLKAKTFDVVVSDYQMPERDGLDFLRELRDKGNNVPFVMFTGRGREEVAIEALNFGADQYLNKTGDPEAVYGELAHSIRRIVKAKQDEERLRESEEKYRSLFENAKDVTLTLDLKGQITSINKAAVEYGFRKDEVIGRNVLKYTPKKYWPRLLKDLAQLARGKNVEGTIELVTPKGKKQAEYWSNPILIDDKVVGVQSILKDVTERKRAEEDLSASEEKYRRLMDEAPMGLCNIDLKGKVTYVNKRFEERSGYSREEIVGKNGFKLGLFSDEALKLLAKRMKARLMEKPPRRMQVQVKCKDGKWIWVEIEAEVFKKHGIPVGLQLASRDITERKRMENNLRKSEEKYRSILESSPDAITVTDLNGNITGCNEATVTLHGFSSKEEVIGRNALMFFPEREQKRAMENLKKVLEQGSVKNIEYTFLTKEGKEFSGELSASVIKDSSGNPVAFVAITKDISERKRAEEALRESQDKFEGLFMGNPEAAVFVDSSFHVLDVNPRFESLFGYSLDEVKGKYINDLVVPEDKMEDAAMLDKESRKGYVYRDTVRKRKDGTLVSVSVSAAPIITAAGSVSSVAIYKDISQLKSAEKAVREMMMKLAEVNEKLHVVGRLTRHDVRNKLSLVTSNVYLAKQRLTGDNKTLQYLCDIESAVCQTVGILDFAGTYEKLGMEELGWVNVEKSVEEAATLFPELNVKIVNDCGGLTVLADSLLRQLFYNLIHNSSTHGERVSQIRVYYKEVGKDQLKLVYEDDGVGIPDAEKDKIFREGYGRGTGYGLYLIRKMCEVYGWIIRETGKPGEGARFTITIPKMNESGKESYRI